MTRGERVDKRLGNAVMQSQRVLVSVLIAVASLEAAAHPYGELRLAFEENRGQTDPEAKYVARGPGYTVFLTAEGAVWRTRNAVITMRLAGDRRSGQLRGVDPQPGRAHYFIGNDSRGWRTDVPVFSRVEYGQVYPGIGLVFYGNRHRLEYDFLVAPGGDPAAIRLQFGGVERLRVARNGDLVLRTVGGEWRHYRPQAHQGGRKVAAAYVIRGPREIGFRVGVYDRSEPLVIDPTLSYATYLGGSGDDRAYGVALDASGCAYLLGETSSADFPKVGAAQPGFGGYTDVFVAKLNAAGTALVYSTYLGGSNRDSGRGIALDSDGNAYLTGFTYSPNFPVTTGVVQASLPGSVGAFAAKLSASGSVLAYSTYLGGGGTNYGMAIAVDSSANAYVAGFANSLNFPVTTGALRGTFGGGCYDGFVTKLNASASALLYSTYLGGSGGDTARGIAVDASGAAYVTGHTESADFPVQGAIRAQKAGASDAFVAKLNAGGTGLVYSTFLGGRGSDFGAGIALDSGGNAYVTGSTASADFPVGAGVFQTSYRGGHDAFVTKLNAAGNAFAYSTYLGGAASEEGSAIAVTPSGQAYVAGYSSSVDFPSREPLQTGFKGYFDAFVSLMNNTGTALEYSTLLGGPGDDRATGIAVDASAAAYVTGFFSQPGFPSTAGAHRTTSAGSFDAFAAKLAAGNSPPQAVSVSPSTGGGSSQTFSFLFSDPDGAADLRYEFVLINQELRGNGACLLHYDGTRLWMMNDAGTAWLGPIIPGDAATLQNSQCALSGAGSSVSASGQNLTLNLALTFQSAFAGVKAIYMQALDRSGLDTRMQQRGSWTVGSGVNQPPSVVSVTPSSGSGYSQTFSFLFSDPDGAADLRYEFVLINQDLRGNGACLLHYDGLRLWLVNDAGTAWLGPIIPGDAATLQNSQCALGGAGSSVSTSGQNLTLNLALTFQSAFVGPKAIFMQAFDRSGLDTGMQQRGSWTVGSGVNQAPSVVSVTPSSGSGSSQTFSFLFSDPDGAADLRYEFVLINQELRGDRACLLHYDGLRLWMVNDAGTGWLGPMALGSASRLENSQCVVSGAGSSVTLSGTELTLRVALTFKPAFAGTKTIYMQSNDRGGVNTGMQQRGSWTVP